MNPEHHFPDIYKPMGNQRDELGAAETKIDEREYERWEQASPPDGTISIKKLGAVRAALKRPQCFKPLLSR